MGSAHLLLTKLWEQQSVMFRPLRWLKVPVAVEVETVVATVEVVEVVVLPEAEVLPLDLTRVAPLVFDEWEHVVKTVRVYLLPEIESFRRLFHR